MSITARTKLCMTIGDPAGHSLSPLLHNAAYEALGIDGDFVYVACTVKPEALAAFAGGARAMGIRGISCTLPHKIAIMEYLDEIDDIAQSIGAVNTVVNDGGRLKGYNADWLGVVGPLEAQTSLRGKRVALLGSGGAARAAAYGLTQRGAILTIYNRTLSKAQALAQAFGAQAQPLDHLADVKGMDIIVNATAVGLAPHDNESPLEKELITSKHIVFDFVYAPLETRLLREARQQGARTIYGTEMLLYQAKEQFKLFTGHEAPEDAMREALSKSLGAKEITDGR